mmetsp:Transcript_7129/g.5909  ORF Transcript_7129/g.5909 Transcript_7129/m.5909 type:complete len:86 (-) Transcript_7129:829-1086(-)
MESEIDCVDTILLLTSIEASSSSHAYIKVVPEDQVCYHSLHHHYSSSYCSPVLKPAVPHTLILKSFQMSIPKLLELPTPVSRAAM